MIMREWKVLLLLLRKRKLYQIPTYRMKKEDVKTIVFRYILYTITG